MEVSDGTREQAVHEKASELVSKWLKEMTTAMETEEGQVVNGITLPAYMTAGYVLYLKLTEFVKAQGGSVTTLSMSDDKAEG